MVIGTSVPFNGDLHGQIGVESLGWLESIVYRVDEMKYLVWRIINHVVCPYCVDTGT